MVLEQKGKFKHEFSINVTGHNLFDSTRMLPDNYRNTQYLNLNRN